MLLHLACLSRPNSCNPTQSFQAIRKDALLTPSPEICKMHEAVQVWHPSGTVSASELLPISGPQARAIPLKFQPALSSQLERYIDDCVRQDLFNKNECADCPELDR